MAERVKNIKPGTDNMQPVTPDTSRIEGNLSGTGNKGFTQATNDINKLNISNDKKDELRGQLADKARGGFFGDGQTKATEGKKQELGKLVIDSSTSTPNPDEIKGKTFVPQSKEGNIPVEPKQKETPQPPSLENNYGVDFNKYKGGGRDGLNGLKRELEKIRDSKGNKPGTDIHILLEKVKKLQKDGFFQTPEQVNNNKEVLDNIDKQKNEIVNNTTNKKEKKPIETISDFKAQGSTTEGLVELLKAGVDREATTDIQVKGNKVTGVRNGELFEWTIDKAGNPIRKSLGRVDTEQQLFAESKGIPFKRLSSGELEYAPTNLSDAMDLVNQFGQDTKFSKDSSIAIKSSAIFKKYGKYKNASTETYIDGLKKGDIADGSEVWDLVVKMNGGNPTPNMLEAIKQYETNNKVNNINENSNEVATELTETSTTVIKKSAVDETNTKINKLDNKYIQTQVDTFKDIQDLYSEFKNGRTKTNEYRQEATEIASTLDELRTNKRKILRNIKKRFPNLPLSTQLTMARQETEAIDDEIFSTEREYNIAFSNYQFHDTEDKAELDFNLKKINMQSNLMKELYGIQRGELIDQRDIQRADEKLKQDREIAKQKFEDSIKSKNKEIALKFAYDVALLDKKQELSDKTIADFKGFSTSGGLQVFNPNDGTVSFVPAPTTNNGSEFTVVETTDADGNVTRKVTTKGKGIPTTGTANTDLTSMRKKGGPIKFTGNVGNDLNNPGNLVKGGLADKFAIGHSTVTGKDGVTRDFLVFKNLEDGYNAVASDLQAKIDGNSTTISPNESLGKLLDVWVGGSGAGKGYKNTVARITGLNLNSPISGMDANVILKGIKVAEGATTKTGNDYSSLVSTQTEIPATGDSGILQVSTGVDAPAEEDVKARLTPKNAFTRLDFVDQDVAINTLGGLLRGGTKEGKKELRPAINLLKEKVVNLEQNNPGLTDLFSVLTVGGSKLSDIEGANLERKKIEFAIDGNEDKFIKFVRNKSDNLMKQNDIEINNVKNVMNQYDRIQGYLDKIDSNKLKQAIKFLGDKTGQTSGEDFDKLKTALGINAALFVKEISGAAVTDQEFSRLADLLPGLGDNIELAKNKLEEFRLTRYENNVNKAIPLLGNDKGVFFQLYPELQGIEKYKPKKSNYQKNFKRSTPSIVDINNY